MELTNYHLRVTIATGQHKEFVKDWQKQFAELIFRAVYASEISDKGVEHLHGHIIYKVECGKPHKDAISYFMKKKGLSGGQKYNHDCLRKEPRNNELYVIKDCKIILWYRYEEEEQTELLNATQEINEDKAKDPKLKMIEVLKKKHKNLLKFTMNQLLEEIKRVYILDWDKFPPPQCKALAEYITVKEVDEYTKNPKYKESPLGDHKVLLVPPLAKSWNYHCERQFQDDQDPDNINWDE